MVKLTLESLRGHKALKVDPEQAVLVAEMRSLLMTQDVEEMTVPFRQRRNCCRFFLVLNLALMLAGLVVILARLYRNNYTFAGDDHLKGSLPLEPHVFHCGLTYTDGQHGGLPVTKDLEHAGRALPLKSVEEDVEIDIEHNVEIIRLAGPGFSESNQANIVHDFHRLLTAYYDISLKKCYVIPMNTSIIMPPRRLFDLLRNNKLGTYLPQSYLVHEDLVVTEQMLDVGGLGVFIFRMCFGHPTFRLKHREIELGAFVNREAEKCRDTVSFANHFAIKTRICERSS